MNCNWQLGRRLGWPAVIAVVLAGAASAALGQVGQETTFCTLVDPNCNIETQKCAVHCVGHNPCFEGEIVELDGWMEAKAKPANNGAVVVKTAISAQGYGTIESTGATRRYTYGFQDYMNFAGPDNMHARRMERVISAGSQTGTTETNTTGTGDNFFLVSHFIFNKGEPPKPGITERFCRGGGGQ